MPASKAEQVLGWQRKVSFDELVERMVDHDLEVETDLVARSR